MMVNQLMIPGMGVTRSTRDTLRHLLPERQILPEKRLESGFLLIVTDLKDGFDFVVRYDSDKEIMELRGILGGQPDGEVLCNGARVKEIYDLSLDIGTQLQESVAWHEPVFMCPLCGNRQPRSEFTFCPGCGMPVCNEHPQVCYVPGCRCCSMTKQQFAEMSEEERKTWSWEDHPLVESRRSR